MTSISKTSSITKMASISSSNWGSSISSVGHWGGNSLGNSLDGVGAGFVNNWLVDSLVGPDGSANGLGSISWDSLEDGLSNVVSSDNWGRLVGGNWGRDVCVSGLSHRVGQGGDLGDDLSISMSLSS